MHVTEVHDYQEQDIGARLTMTITGKNGMPSDLLLQCFKHIGSIKNVKKIQVRWKVQDDCNGMIICDYRQSVIHLTPHKSVEIKHYHLSA